MLSKDKKNALDRAIKDIELLMVAVGSVFTVTG